MIKQANLVMVIYFAYNIFYGVTQVRVQRITKHNTKKIGSVRVKYYQLKFINGQ